MYTPSAASSRPTATLRARSPRYRTVPSLTITASSPGILSGLRQADDDDVVGVVPGPFVEGAAAGQQGQPGSAVGGEQVGRQRGLRVPDTGGDDVAHGRRSGHHLNAGTRLGAKERGKRPEPTL